MQCEDLVKYLSDYLDDDLPEALRADAREHLLTCENCRVVLDSTQRAILLYREAGQRQHIPLDRQQALYHQLEAAFKREETP